MENWQKGDIAICIIATPLNGVKCISPPLKLHSEYIVHGIKICSCGGVSLDVSISTPNEVKCSDCLTSQPADGTWWCSAKRFVKKQVVKQEDEVLEYYSIKKPSPSLN